MQKLSATNLPIMSDYTKKLGSFTVGEDGVIRVTDPCYDTNTWCVVMLDVAPGMYDAYAIYRHEPWNRTMQVGGLAIFHESIPEYHRDIYNFDGQEVAGNAGVDSGQCGFFIDDAYPRDVAQFEYESRTFYGKACEVTSNHCGAGIVVHHDTTYGVVSGTFYGDGGYDCFVIKNEAGKVTAAMLDYSDIFDRHEEDENEDEEDYDG